MFLIINLKKKTMTVKMEKMWITKLTKYGKTVKGTKNAWQISRGYSVTKEKKIECKYSFDKLNYKL